MHTMSTHKLKAAQSDSKDKFYLRFPTKDCSRLQSQRRGGYFNNLQSCAAAYLISDEVAGFIAKDYNDGGLFFFDEDDKKNIRDNVRLEDESSKFQSFVAHLLHLGYDLAISPSKNSRILPWLEAAMQDTNTNVNDDETRLNPMPSVDEDSLDSV